MTIVLSQETEDLLKQCAREEGADENALADKLLSDLLREREEERQATLSGIRRGMADGEAGRVRPAAEFAAEMRTKYSLPVRLSDSELQKQS
jgi:predicted transcriptional regulator